jgi:uncharacterized lipoprotein
MKQAVKATALALAVSLLSGCSSSEAKACKLAVQTQADYMKQKNDLLAQAKIAYANATPTFNGAYDLYDQSQEALLKSNKVIVNNPQCFTPQQVVEAQLAVDKK